MHFSQTAIAATVTLIAQPVSADFLIFIGATNQYFMGGGVPGGAQTPAVFFFNNPPDCDDNSNAINWGITFYNDASDDGIACEGCDDTTAPKEWDITRFEMNDYNDSTFDRGDQPHITLYKDEANGGWGMYDTDMNSLGSCTRPDPIQELTCDNISTADSTAGLFQCTCDFGIKDSN